MPHNARHTHHKAGSRRRQPPSPKAAKPKNAPNPPPSKLDKVLKILWGCVKIAYLLIAVTGKEGPYAAKLMAILPNIFKEKEGK
jgi:hypothetical protein